MSKLIEAALAEIENYAAKNGLAEAFDYGESDEAEEHHEEHADKTKPTHEWKDHDVHHKIWHTTHKGKKSTLYHVSEPNASDAPVMRFHQAGHHSPEAVKKSLKDYE